MSVGRAAAVVGADDDERRVEEVGHARALAEELGAHGDAEVDAGTLAAGPLDGGSDQPERPCRAAPCCARRRTRKRSESRRYVPISVAARSM